MLYMMLLIDDEANGSEWGTPEFDAEMAGYEAFGEVAGERIAGGEALEPVATATTIRHDGVGTVVSAAPLSEVAEVVGGYYVLDCGDLDEAIELARQIPAAATGAVEVRPVVDLQSGDGAPTGGNDDAPRFLVIVREADSVAGDSEEYHTLCSARRASLQMSAALSSVDSATTVRLRGDDVVVSDGPAQSEHDVVVSLHLTAPAALDDVVAAASTLLVGPGRTVEIRPIMELE